MERGTRKTCPEGHVYYKSSDCPACPECEKTLGPASGDLLSQMSAPARRALQGAGINTVEDLTRFTEKELCALHGFGPASLPVLKKALAAQNLTFRT